LRTASQTALNSVCADLAVSSQQNAVATATPGLLVSILCRVIDFLVCRLLFAQSVLRLQSIDLFQALLTIYLKLDQQHPCGTNLAAGL